MEKGIKKKFLNTLVFLFEKNGLEERGVKHTKDDEFAVDDFLSAEHFQSSGFTREIFTSILPRSNQDEKLKEENRFLLVEDDSGQLIVKYFPNGVEYQASDVTESEKTEENLSKDKKSVKNENENNDDDNEPEDNEPNEPGTAGQNKKNRKKQKNKGKGKVPNEKDLPESEKRESGPKGNAIGADATEGVNGDQNKATEKTVSNKNQKQTKDGKQTVGKDADKERSEQEDAAAESGEDEKIDAFDGISETISSPSDGSASSKKSNKKKSQQKSNATQSDGKLEKGPAKQSEAKEKSNNGKDSKQKSDEKQSGSAKASNEKAKATKEETQSRNTKKPEGAPSKVKESAQKNPEKRKTDEKNELKQKDAKLKTEAASSEDEKSLAETETKKKKKKNAEDPMTKIPKLFEFLFFRDGLTSKKIAVCEDGYVRVGLILEVYSDQYDWTEELIELALGRNPCFSLYKDANRGLLVKGQVIQKPSSDQNAESAEWKDIGKKDGGESRKTGDRATDKGRGNQTHTHDSGASRPGWGGYMPPAKVCSTLFWLLREGATQYNIQFHQPGDFLLIEEILQKVPHFSNCSVEEVLAAVKSDTRNSLALDKANGRPTIRRNENRGPRDMDGHGKSDFHLSKTMSYLLRHGAEKLRLPIQPDGFLFVDDLLNYKDLRSYEEDDVRRVVASNDKQRFFLANDRDTGKLKVRANQGHTFEVPDLDLEEITSAENFPTVIHGTYMQSWNVIKSQGLKRMGRNHIHFAPGEPGSDGVISGMRGSCDVLIFVDLQQALNDGIKFYRSANNVILCPGDERGFLLPKYFASAVQRQPRMKLL